MTRGSRAKRWNLGFWIPVLMFAGFTIWAVAQTVIEFRDGRSSVGWRAVQGVILHSELVGATSSYDRDQYAVHYLFSDTPNWSPRQLMRLLRESNMTTGIGGFSLDVQILENLQSFCGGFDDGGKASFYEHSLGLKFRCGDRIAFGGDAANPAFALRYPVGRVVTVYFDPADPSRSTLERGWTNPSVFDLIAFICFALVLIGGSIWMISGWIERRRRLM